MNSEQMAGNGRAEDGGSSLTRQEYIDILVEHYKDPLNKGRLEDADIQLGGGNPGCGDLITIYLKFDERNRIAEVGFEGEGCTISQAGGSIVTELAKGLTPAEVAALGTQTMFDEMGEEVVKSRVRCATLALGTLQAAVKQYTRNQERIAQGLEPIAQPARFEV